MGGLGRWVGGCLNLKRRVWRAPHIASLHLSFFSATQVRARNDLDVLQPAFERCGKVSHALTAAQPGPKLRLTNFVEMTCPLFRTAALAPFLDGFDPDLKVTRGTDDT